MKSIETNQLIGEIVASSLNHVYTAFMWGATSCPIVVFNYMLTRIFKSLCADSICGVDGKGRTFYDVRSSQSEHAQVVYSSRYFAGRWGGQLIWGVVYCRYGSGDDAQSVGAKW
jgi:hypothetical protein